MCEDAIQRSGVVGAGDSRLRWMDVDDLLQVGRLIADQEELRRTAAGFVGYGSTRPGDRVLLAVDSHYDPQVPEAIATVLRERGAKVDILVADAGPDREFDELDELRVIIRDEPWEHNPRRWEGLPWVESLAVDRKYDLLIHGKGGGIPSTPHRYEACPWLQTEQFAHPSTTFPRDLHVMINNMVWSTFRDTGRGGRVRLTDPEGTDMTYTLLPDYFDDTRRGYGETPWWGHILAHGPTPILAQEDAEGVVAGTTTHFSRPFARIEVELQKGKVEKIEGGGQYGDAWRTLLKETDGIQYPCFPRPGLFWLWEVAIGTNPKIARPSRIDRLSSGGFEWERRRSGIIHMGFGTRWRGAEERWAGERGMTYGHLHVHLLFPTLTIEHGPDDVVEVVKDGRLTVLDDIEVRELATHYGDPDEVLKEEWIPSVPGISAAGDYGAYATDPASFIYGRS